MSNNNCPICLKRVISIDKTVTKCKHVFHFSCLCKNIKFNSETGFKCPVCRDNFIIKNDIDEINKQRINIQATNFLSIYRNYLPVAPNRNTIIPHRRIPRPNVSAVTERERIKKYISDLTFNELKNKIREKGGSSRGYLRESLENRLYRIMRNRQ